MVCHVYRETYENAVIYDGTGRELSNPDHPIDHHFLYSRDSGLDHPFQGGKLRPTTLSSLEVVHCVLTHNGSLDASLCNSAALTNRSASGTFEIPVIFFAYGVLPLCKE